MASDYRRMVGRRVLVFTDDMTFDGTLAHEGRDSLTLSDVNAIADSGEARPVDGQALVPTLRVLWIQCP